VLLLHGLLASPAELRGYGDYLAKQGYTILGVVACNQKPTNLQSAHLSTGFKCN